MKSITTFAGLIALAGLTLAKPLAARGGDICVSTKPKLPGNIGGGIIGGGVICFKEDDLFAICPYDNCVDRCISGGIAGPCNPMDLCDPGLGCALGLDDVYLGR
ncbi:hypothetical protein QBC41DRAFT_334488 [Cercophora samala]|uniref:Uncharacterized protein n=1 Tax=Cercophora samala TaxID=330535 RepID=A0AA40DG06_9PEZI|nr:hypothetical protein QBC41DRAFT_334488 [Cercophora samala]